MVYKYRPWASWRTTSTSSSLSSWVSLSMAPKRRARGRSSRSRRGHDARASCCRKGRRGLLVGGAAAVGEGFLGCDYTLEVLSPITSRIFLPCSFAIVISEHGLRGLWLDLLGCSQLRFWVKLQVDSCCLV